LKGLKTIWQELRIATHQRSELLDITAIIEAELVESGIQEGLCFLFVPHTTAGITINENADPDVARDLIITLERLVPRHGDYRHGEGNSDAHLKASLMGFSCQIPVSGGRLAFGTWQGVYLCEFDGPRQRRLHVGFIKDSQ
jgi:secondary thiamine-phosphate synthase enzyme